MRNGKYSTLALATFVILRFVDFHNMEIIDFILIALFLLDIFITFRGEFKK